MKIEVGIQKSKIITDNYKILSALSNLYSFKTQGYEFTQAYKQKRWDGNKRFITKNGSFRSGLLENVLADLKAINCDPTISYVFDRSEAAISYIGQFTYYDYQEEAIKNALNKKRCLIKAPTGAGKTLIMAGLVKSLGKRQMVILFNAKSLLTQAYDFFVNECNLENIGICFGEGYEYGDIMLCTVQSIDKILDTHLEAAEVLMVDEVHEFSKGPSTIACIESFPKAEYRFGLTATLPEEPIPKHTLIGAFGPPVVCRTTKDLISKGILTKPVIQMINLPKLEDESITSYSEIYENLIINNQNRNDRIKLIVNLIKKSNNKPRILILVKNLEHGQILKELIGSNCFYLKGEDSISDRYSTIKNFINCPTGSVLIGTKILQTGVNIREITHFINARGLKSPIATIQALGRSLRTHETKPVVYVYDFLDKGKYLEKHAKKRLATYRKEGHKVEIL